MPLRERGGERDPSQLQQTAARVGLGPMAVRLLQARGIASDEALRRAAAPRLADLRAPERMAGFPAALDLLLWAHRARVPVGVFGDYDVDGVTTATILAGYLEALGLRVVVRVAHREHGYGLSVADAEAFATAGAKLLLTGDTGTSDVEALAHARARGLRAVVIDHHQVPEQMPPADALINPHQRACEFPFKGLCSAGVAFYLCAALRTRLGAAARPPDPRGLLDLVAVATICDMMPLVEENRVLVARGLALLRVAPRPGLRALLERASPGNESPLDEQTVGFTIGPRLNAPGRLGSAEPSLRLLRARTLAEAQPLAEQVEGMNQQRKALSEQAVTQALATLPPAPLPAAVCVADVAWAPGIVGLVAGALAERVRRPAIALAIDAARGVARGSVRSFGGVDVRAALSSCAPLLERFGGHREAAGLTVAVDRLDALRDAFATACAAQAPSSEPDAVLHDGRLRLSRLDLAFVEGLAGLGPYGVGFPAPRFLGRARVLSMRVLKQRHLALRLGDDGAEIDAIAFGQAPPTASAGDGSPPAAAAAAPLAPGATIEFLFAPSLDVFRGQRRVRVVIEQLWCCDAAGGDGL
ncbi:MAG: single-stranded-DNA-specific exonuclease RecJ [Nannocystaceae bacterium]|nr:single-stranded-DNA-specific exonuclease RecJ [Nannocystaceae bacterium]